MVSPGASRFRWNLVAETLTRPYRLSAPMVALMALVPFYIFIAQLMPGRRLHVLELALDRVLPLQPAWALVYGALYLFLIVLPVLVVRQEDQDPPHLPGIPDGVDRSVRVLFSRIRPGPRARRR